MKPLTVVATCVGRPSAPASLHYLVIAAWLGLGCGNTIEFKGSGVSADALPAERGPADDSGEPTDSTPSEPDDRAAATEPPPSDEEGPEESPPESPTDGNSEEPVTPTPPSNEETQEPREEEPQAPQEITHTYTPRRIVPYDLDLQTTPEDVAYALTVPPAALNSLTLMQAERPEITDTFNQGFLGPMFEQREMLRETAPLDILVVIDNSLSMEDEQDALKSQLGALLTNVADADWRIGVVTTDPRPTECRFRQIDKGQVAPTPEVAFEEAIAAGTTGNSPERGFYKALLALEGSCDSGGFLRDDSAVAVLVVSDEDNCFRSPVFPVTDCDGDGIPSQDDPDEAGEIDGADLVAFLQAREANGAGRGRIYGILWDPADAQCTGATSQGAAYAQAIQQTGGLIGSICETADFGTTLSRISADVSTIVTREFALTALPDDGEVAFEVDGVPAELGFQLVNGSLRLDEVPAGDELVMRYRSGGAPLRDTFTLSAEPVGGSVDVTVNGAPLPADAYAIEAASGAIRFAEPPPERATLAVQYRQDVPLGRDFELTAQVVEDSLEVWLDGDPIGFSWDAGTGILTLDEAPWDGEMIEVRFVEPDTLRTRYGLPDTQGRAPQGFVVEGEDGLPVAARLDQTDVVVPRDVALDGASLQVSYQLEPLAAAGTITLDKLPLPGTVSFTQGGEPLGCEHTLEGAVLRYRCAVAGTLPVKVHALVEGPPKHRFVFPAEVGADTTWQVWLDGQPTERFQITDGAIKIDPRDLRGVDEVVITARWSQP